jgi:Na+-transporting NADH:ubiquinone oxidoreductase subunit NqrF
MLSESLFESNKASSDASWKPSNHDEDIDENGRKEAKKNSKEAQSVEAKEQQRVSCPLVLCKAKVVHLPRHMHNVRNWTNEVQKVQNQEEKVAR